MKYINRFTNISLILLILLGSAKAQTFTPIHNGQAIDWLSAVKYFGIPYGATPALNSTRLIPGALFWKTTDSTVYGWTGSQWRLIGGGGSVGNAINGITKTGSDFGLGGRLNASTTISGYDGTTNFQFKGDSLSSFDWHARDPTDWAKGSRITASPSNGFRVFQDVVTLFEAKRSLLQLNSFYNPTTNKLRLDSNGVILTGKKITFGGIGTGASTDSILTANSSGDLRMRNIESIAPTKFWNPRHISGGGDSLNPYGISSHVYIDSNTLFDGGDPDTELTLRTLKFNNFKQVEIEVEEGTGGAGNKNTMLADDANGFLFSQNASPLLRVGLGGVLMKSQSSGDTIEVSNLGIKMSILPSGAATDSVIVQDAAGYLKKRNASAFGGGASNLQAVTDLGNSTNDDLNLTTGAKIVFTDAGTGSNTGYLQPSNYGTTYSGFGVAQRFHLGGYGLFSGVNASGRPNVVGTLFGYNHTAAGAREVNTEAGFGFRAETDFQIGGEPHFEFHLPEFTTLSGVMSRPLSLYLGKVTGNSTLNAQLDAVNFIKRGAGDSVFLSATSGGVTTIQGALARLDIKSSVINGTAGFLRIVPQADGEISFTNTGRGDFRIQNSATNNFVYADSVGNTLAIRRNGGSDLFTGALRTTHTGAVTHTLHSNSSTDASLTFAGSGGANGSNYATVGNSSAAINFDTRGGVAPYRFYVGGGAINAMDIFATGTVGVGTNNTEIPSAILSANSTTKGFLVPRMTRAQIAAISSPALGLLTYSNTDNKLLHYNGSAHVPFLDSLTGSGGSSYSKQSHTSGSTVTVSNATTWLVVNPSATLAALTITMSATPTDGQEVRIDFGGTVTSGSTITALTISPNTGHTILQVTTPTTADAGEGLKYKFESSTSIWRRQN